MSIGHDNPSAVVKRDLRSSLVEAGFLQERLAKLEASVQTLIAEVEYLRGERAAVVAYLRAYDGESYDFADDIECGEHRKEAP